MSDDVKKLNPRHAEFVRQYFLAGRNASEAYRRVYPKSKNPDVDGPALLGKPGIQAAVQEREVKAEAKFEIKFESIVRELATIGFGSVGDVLEWNEDDVSLVPKDKLTEEQIKFIDNIQYKRRLVGSGKYDGLGNEIKEPEVTIRVGSMSREKVKALELLSKLLGYDKDAGGSTTEAEKVLHSALLKLNSSPSK